MGIIFRKGTDREIDSYSAFYDNGHLKSTGLAGYFREKGASQVYVRELEADICVYYSLHDALKERFACFFIEDASQPLDEESFKAIKDKMTYLGVQIISSEDI